MTDLKFGDNCPRCGEGILKNFPILGTDFTICSIDCGYKIYSSETMLDNIEERFKLFMKEGWRPPAERVIK